MLQAKVALVEIFHIVKEQVTGMVLGMMWLLENIHQAQAEVVMVVTTAEILARIELLLMVKEF